MNRSHLAALSALALAITLLAIRRYHWRRPAARWTRTWPMVGDDAVMVG